jgi:phenylpropionate dioxygenase-like ring-hydroxylating dioxygenase large terminal subunit
MTLIDVQSHALAPPAEAFATFPVGWYVFGRAREVDRSPVSRDIFGRRVVVYRAGSGELVAMAARCWHMGADLGGGSVRGDNIVCPFHGWQFDPSGRCARVCGDDDPPLQARQSTYAITQRAGLLYIFNAALSAYDLPFFDGVSPGELVSAAPFEFELNCPWWLVGTNGFDVQHFLAAHDRTLIGAPVVSSPHALARRITAEFAVTGASWRDRLIRARSGAKVTMDVTVWSGNLVFVQAHFRRTTTYGMVEIVPIPGGQTDRTRVRVHIFVCKRHAPLYRIDAAVRRQFVRAFLQPDARLLDGAVYHPRRLIEADRVMIDYLNWLAPASHGRTPNEILP